MYTVEAIPAPELGNTSFVVADTDRGVGLVIDPLRDIERYLNVASDLNVKLTHALDTHLHNDFVSGRRELQAETGADIGELEAGSELTLGDTTLRAIATPGHERNTNPFFQTTEVMPFLARALTQSRYPTYYRDMSAINRGGAPLIGRTLPPLTPLEADEVAQMMDSGAAVIDIRTGRDYDAGHIPGSYQVGIDGPVSAWVGWLVAGGRPRARSRTHLRARRAAPRGRDPARRASGGSLRVRVSRRNRSEPSRAGRPEADHPRERRILGLGPPPPCGVTPLADIRSGYFTSPSASSRVIGLIAGSCGVGGRDDAWVGQEVRWCSRRLGGWVGAGTA